MLWGSSPCTDLSLVVHCDYVNEHVNVKLALSFRTTWLTMMMFLVQFLFVALKLKYSRILEKEIRRKHATIREHEVKVTVQISQICRAF